MAARILTAVVGLGVIIPLLLFGGPGVVWWIMLPFLLIALDEYVKMAVPGIARLEWALFLVVGTIVTATGVFAPTFLPTVLCLGMMGAMTVPMFRRPEVELGATHAIRLGFGLVYVSVLLAPLVHIRKEEDGLALIFFLLAATWLGDTGAYFAGRAFGKTPLFPRVSPKKTVEGLIGGVVLSVVGACAIKAVTDIHLSWPVAIVVAAALDVAGVVGDLAESMLKRAFGVKDSGWIMPGHGGILDRIDSLLFSGPLLWLVLQVRAILAA
jgi:phosphatidate cytidylyltransferase